MRLTLLVAGATIVLALWAILAPSDRLDGRGVAAIVGAVAYLYLSARALAD